MSLCPVVKQILSDGLGILDTKEMGVLLYARYAECAALSPNQWLPFRVPTRHQEEWNNIYI